LFNCLDPVMTLRLMDIYGLIWI